MKKLMLLTTLLSMNVFAMGESSLITHGELELLKSKCASSDNCIVEDSGMIGRGKIVTFNAINSEGRLVGEHEYYDIEINNYVFSTDEGEQVYTVHEPIAEHNDACVTVILPEDQFGDGSHCKTTACQQMYQQQQPSQSSVSSTTSCLEDSYEPMITLESFEEKMSRDTAIKTLRKYGYIQGDKIQMQRPVNGNPKVIEAYEVILGPLK